MGRSRLGWVGSGIFMFLVFVEILEWTAIWGVVSLGGRLRMAQSRWGKVDLEGQFGVGGGDGRGQRLLEGV